MSAEITSYPLTWPAGWKRAAPGQRKSGAFGQREVSYREGKRALGWKKALSVSEAVARVIDEVMRLGVMDRGDVIISSNTKTRLDGLPYSNQPEPSDPGVAVYWRLPGDKQAKCMAVDRYARTADNLAAIAATIAAMRAIERHGGAEILERAFLGFQALPPPMTGQRPWWEVLGFEIADAVTLDKAEQTFRDQSKKLHPDVGGDASQFSELADAIRQARETLGS